MDINASIKNRSDLKSYFIKNTIPTESNFAELIESVLNQREDGLVKAPGAPLSIEATGDPSSQKKAINFYADFANEKPEWILSLNPRIDPTKPETARAGFSISDADGNSMLFVDATGKVGVGNIAPGDELDVGGYMRILTDTNPLRFTSAWSNFTGSATNHAEISNDTGSYKTLMIVGNRSAGGVRRVSVWDRLEINGDLAVNGTGTLDFNPSVRQMINLWKTNYGIGVQSSTQYFRTDRNFAWYKGGSHNNGALDPGGGAVQMVISDGNVGIGTTAPAKKLHIQQAAISAPLLNEARRPGIALTGQYPELNLFSRINNVNHGPTIRLGSYNADTGTATKQWVIGTAGRNSRFLDFGFSTLNNGNPHNGIRNHQGKTVLTLLENGNVGIGAPEPSTKLEVAGGIKTTSLDITGGALLGYETSVTNFGAAMQSGFYQNGGQNIAGDVPDNSHSWSHMIVARHSHKGNNHQLQIASSYAENNRIFFRKIATGGTASRNPAWHELTTLARENSRFIVTSGYVATTARRTGALYSNWSYNYAFVSPPSGFTMSHLKGFIASMAVIHFAGDVNSDDSIWCRWKKESTRVRVICNNSENRAGSAINYLAIWRK